MSTQTLATQRQGAPLAPATPLLLLLSLGHLTVDANIGAMPVLFPMLQESYHLSIAAVAALMPVAQLSSSVIQPLFGLVSDRVSTRLILPAATLLSALGYLLIALADQYALIVLGVFIMGVGVAAYHPEASKLAHRVGGSQRGRAMSIFALGGNIGVAIGPLAMGLLLPFFGIQGSLALIPLTVPVVWLLWRALPHLYSKVWESLGPTPHAAGAPQGAKARRQAMLRLIVVIMMRSWVHTSLLTFIPLYYVSHLGQSPTMASLLLTTFLLAGAVGTAVGGPAADRLGRRKVIVGSLTLSVPLLLVLPVVGTHPAVFAVLALSGAALVASFAVTTVLGQEILPDRVGLASGLTLGFSVGTGGIGAVLLALVADRFGLQTAMYVTAVLPFTGAALALTLPNDRRRPTPPAPTPHPHGATQDAPPQPEHR